jgi:acyl-CoA thioester hydrolase
VRLRKPAGTLPIKPERSPLIIGTCMVEPIAAQASFAFPVRVYWEDTDAGGVVFYANYLKFFERARTEWLRSLGIQQQRLREETGAIFVVGSTSLRYHRPARLDDSLLVTARLAQLGRATMTFEQQALRGRELLADGEIRIGCVDGQSFQPRRIPPALLDRLST